MSVRLGLDWASIIEEGARIVDSYETGVTLRQLFYRLVAAERLPNTLNCYSRLSELTAKGRREGTFPDLVDNTRRIRRPLTLTGVGNAMTWLANVYGRDRTEGQAWSVYLGVEKNALVTLLDSWFEDFGVPILALGGYASQTYIQDIQRDIRRCRQGERQSGEAVRGQVRGARASGAGCPASRRTPHPLPRGAR